MLNPHLVQTFIEGYLNTLYQDIAQEEARIIDVIRESTEYVSLHETLSNLFNSKKLAKLVQQILDEKRFRSDGYFLSKLAEGSFDIFDAENYIKTTPPLVASIPTTPLSASEAIMEYVKANNLKAPSPERLSGMAEEVEIYATENAVTYEEAIAVNATNLKKALT